MPTAITSLHSQSSVRVAGLLQRDISLSEMLDEPGAFADETKIKALEAFYERKPLKLVAPREFTVCFRLIRCDNEYKLPSAADVPSWICGAGSLQVLLRK